MITADPISMLVVGGAMVGTGMLAKQQMPSAKSASIGEVKLPAEDAPSITAANVSSTMATGTEKLNKRLAASRLTRDWGTLTLSKPALLGVA